MIFVICAVGKWVTVGSGILKKTLSSENPDRGDMIIAKRLFTSQPREGWHYYRNAPLSSYNPDRGDMIIAKRLIPNQPREG